MIPLSCGGLYQWSLREKFHEPCGSSSQFQPLVFLVGVCFQESLNTESFSLNSHVSHFYSFNVPPRDTKPLKLIPTSA